MTYLELDILYLFTVSLFSILLRSLNWAVSLLRLKGGIDGDIEWNYMHIETAVPLDF